MNNQQTRSTRQSLPRTAFMLAAGLTFFLAGCKKSADVIAPVATGPTNDPVAANGGVNDWILSNMRDYYYWNDKIPAKPDTTLAPDRFFDSLLNKFDATTNPEGDRFSWIQESATELQAALSGESTTTGMEYGLFLRSAGSDNIIAQVYYVLPGSPAQKAGLKRGDIITKVNGQLLSRTNYQTLLFSSGNTLTYGLASISNNALTDTDVAKTVTAAVYQENPVFLDSTYTIGNKKVGYLVYNQFVPGANGSRANEYDAQIDAIFGKFKAQGVNELVLDLRYNPGGYTNSSTNLASLIGKGVSASKLYFREEWNNTVTTLLRNDPKYGDAFFVENFVDKANNIGGSLNRVFVLTTDQTASASELIINGLRPYMSVVTIGTASYGKNVGSITISDDTGKIRWGMQPIVFRSFNSLNQSDYWTGFAPGVEVEEPLNLLPLGDVREALLGTALTQITGSLAGGRVGSPNANPLPSFGSSIERKAGSRFGMVKEVKALPGLRVQ